MWMLVYWQHSRIKKKSSQWHWLDPSKDSVDSDLIPIEWYLKPSQLSFNWVFVSVIGLTQTNTNLRAHMSLAKIICGEKRLSGTGSQPSNIMLYRSFEQSAGLSKRRFAARNSRSVGVLPREKISHIVVAYAQTSALKSNLACSKLLWYSNGIHGKLTNENNQPPRLLINVDFLAKWWEMCCETDNLLVFGIWFLKTWITQTHQ